MITDRLLRLLVLAFRDSVITLRAIACNVNNNLDEVLLAIVCTVYSGNIRWSTRDMLQTKKKRCKQKRNAANKKETLQTKRKRCKQKRNAANKKETLQTKKKRCKQKRNAANKKETLQIKKYAAKKKRELQIKDLCCK